ncbi:aldose 1-epimerase family protein [Microbacterium sp. RD1]|uniref:aldose 1-epimerase family protein n=1 Tax=Microbacterium sp. RD1 TaxID=3457313 RepID=UPI003FA61051
MSFVPADPTGHRFRLTEGPVTAEIAQVGAALRALTVDGVDVVPRYPDDLPAPAAAGTVLVPWPNRIRDGRWTQRGVERQLAITEPALGNASHGLLRFAPYVAESLSPGAVTLRADVFPQTGYPFSLETRVTYALGSDGVTVRHEVRNAGADDAPVALGAHPFLQISTADTADLVIRASGQTRLVVDERMLPSGEEPVDEATDLRAGRRVGDLNLDVTYGNLHRDEDGRVRTTLTAPDGRVLTLWQGIGMDWTQVFTTDRYTGHPLAIAVEPLTAAPDAFNSGAGLNWLAPGESLEREWGVTLSPRELPSGE